jgi:iron complex outermembrane receptor protein
MKTSNFRHVTLAATLLVTTTLVDPMAHAAEHPLQLAQAAQATVKSYDIPAGPLGAAITAYGEASGLRLLVTSATIGERRSPGVSGQFTAEQALRRLLDDTGLTYRFTGSNTVTLVEAPRGGSATVLPPVTVEGRRTADETAWGHVDGYVAKRAATATKTDTPLIETPQSISVVTRDQMDAQGLQSLQQSLRYSAGVVPETRANFGGYDIIYGRGFPLQRYLDGMKLQGNDGFITPQPELYNVERVELLRGPSSIIYGQATPGGIVNMVSKRPTEIPVHEVMLKAGTFDNYQGGFDLGGPLSDSGKMLFRLTGFAKSAETQVDYTKEERIAISPSLAFRIGDDTTLTLLTSYQNDPWVGLYNLVPARGSVQSNPNGRLPRSFYTGDPSFNTNEREQYSAGYLLEHDLSDAWTLRQNLRYLHTDGRLDQVSPLNNGLAANGRTLTRFVQAADENNDAFTVDNQAQAKFATGVVDHTSIVGFDYQRTSTEMLLGQALGPSLDIFNPVYGQTITRPAYTTTNSHQIARQYGLYAQDQLKYDRWVVLLGGRGDWASAETDNRLDSTRTGQSDRAFSGRGGLVYLFDNGIAPYVSYSESFQPQGGTKFGGQPLDPSEGAQYEAGVKYQPSGLNSFVTAAVFDLTQSNVSVSDPAHSGSRLQIGEVSARGFELEAKANLFEGFNLIASYTRLDAEVTKTTTAADLHKTPQYTPKHTASTWADYTIQHGDFAGLGFGGGVRYVGLTYGDTANAIRVPNYTLFDAAVYYDFGMLSPDLKGISFAINAANLFDKEYVSECTNSNCLYGTGRTVMGTLRYRW